MKKTNNQFVLVYSPEVKSVERADQVAGIDIKV
jgi:hypothetical protein